MVSDQEKKFKLKLSVDFAKYDIKGAELEALFLTEHFMPQWKALVMGYLGQTVCDPK